MHTHWLRKSSFRNLFWENGQWHRYSEAPFGIAYYVKNWKESKYKTRRSNKYVAHYIIEILHNILRLYHGIIYDKENSPYIAEGKKQVININVVVLYDPNSA